MCQKAPQRKAIPLGFKSPVLCPISPQNKEQREQ